MLRVDCWLPGRKFSTVRRRAIANVAVFDALKQSDPTGYGNVIGEINTLLNSNGGIVLGGLDIISQGINPSDKAFAQVLAGVRESLGGNIDFANQAHREALGNALTQHIRETGGCKVTNDEANGC